MRNPEVHHRDKVVNAPTKEWRSRPRRARASAGLELRPAPDTDSYPPSSGMREAEESAPLPPPSRQEVRAVCGNHGEESSCSVIGLRAVIDSDHCKRSSSADLTDRSCPNRRSKVAPTHSSNTPAVANGIHRGSCAAVGTTRSQPMITSVAPPTMSGACSRARAPATTARTLTAVSARKRVGVVSVNTMYKLGAKAI